MTRLVLVSAVLVLVVGCGPVWRIPGGRLYGEVVTEPVSDWSFTDEVRTIAVETRPSFPHSVTIVCFTHGSDLYFPSFNAASKNWPEFVRQNPAVRLEIDGKIYPGRVTRVTTDQGEWRALLGSFAAKYIPGGAAPAGDQLPDVIFFRFEHEAIAG